MATAEVTNSKPQAPVLPRILVVDDEPGLLELVGDVVGREMGCTVVAADTIASARKVLTTQGIELLVADVNLPDGDGMSLLSDLQRFQPAAAAVVMTGSPSMDGAITAIRSGAVDFVPKPFTGKQLIQRVKEALGRQAAVAKQEKRIEKLRLAVRKLNEARRMIGKKVDLLCNDLVGAYGELSRQFDGVRNQESFRKTLDKAKDLEQLLCHGMDWLLREIGYSNIAVWLATEDGDTQLGAYMKYTIAGEPAITDAVKRVVLPLAMRDGETHIRAEELADQFSAEEMKVLKDQEFLAANCTYLGDSLAAMVFFRDARSPFTDDDQAILKAVSPLFAVALATVVRGVDEDEAGEENFEQDRDNEGPFLEGPDNIEDSFEGPAKPKQAKKKPDPADWWKRGELPPF